MLLGRHTCATKMDRGPSVSLMPPWGVPIDCNAASDPDDNSSLLRSFQAAPQNCLSLLFLLASRSELSKSCPLNPHFHPSIAPVITYGVTRYVDGRINNRANYEPPPDRRPSLQLWTPFP